ncbi:phosphatidylglycerol lysyltransferase domain-containing protein [Alloscardovia criceti]|uniref:phosphatidylglycerol lysyltransferase domain-containing protein n=1 Tax=Alloscardovia criceti TaxID=356828 RepID=UPI0003820FD9|nr:phosphatidylglycerol lysyltransferase domain-containing protein [Alloscardovia criceti]
MKAAQTATQQSKKSSRGIAQSFATLGKDLVKFLMRRPLSLIFAAIFVLVNIGMRVAWDLGFLRDSSLPAGTVDKFPGTFFRISFEHLSGYGWLRSLGTLVIVNTLPSIVIGVLLIVICFGLAERKLGILKSLFVSLVSTTIGLSSAIALYYAAYSGTMRWSALKNLPVNYGVTVAVIGAFMAASATMSPLWQRRISVIVYASAATLILYSGEFVDYALLLSAFVGQMCGYMVTSNNVYAVVSTYKYIGVIEKRRIFAVIYTILAFGPIVSTFSRVHAGPLSAIGMLMSSDTVSLSNATMCENNSLRSDCIVLHRVLGADGSLSLSLSLTLFVVMLTIAWGLLKGSRVAAWTAIVMSSITALLTASFYVFLPLGQAWYFNLSLWKRVAYMFTHGALMNVLLLIAIVVGFIIALVMNFEAFPRQIRRTHVMMGAMGIVFAGIILGSISLWSTADMRMQYSGHDWMLHDVVLLVMTTLTHFFPMGFLHQTWAVSSLASHSTWHHALAFGSAILFWVIVEAVLLTWLNIKQGAHEAEQSHVDAVLKTGGESMSFMSTWDGNNYWFSEDQKSAIAYRVYLNMAIAVTGPFGPADNYENALIGFSKFCEEHGWTPVMYSVHDSQREILESWGWNSLDVGTEMIINPREWKTTGKKWQDIRTAVNKASREGITDVLSTFKAEPVEIRQQIMDLSEEWAEEKSLPEMKFTLGGVEELMDSRVKILYAIDEEGTVQAVTSWLPTYRQGHIVGWTLDFMRHRNDSMKGIMEFLIARMAQRLHDQGEEDPENSVEFLSLSAAPLSGMEVREGQSEFLSHALQLMGKLLEPAYGFGSLFFFKKKFQPHEQHVYIVYPDSAKLVQVSLAIGHAYLPQMSANDLLALLRTMRGDA